VSALKSSFDFCSEALGHTDDSRLAEPTQGFGGKQGRACLVHPGLVGGWVDYYGGDATDLRLNGLLPPTAKK